MTITRSDQPGLSSLSNAALRFQESAIRRTGILGAAVPGLISLAAGYPAPEMFPWPDLQAIAGDLLDGPPVLFIRRVADPPLLPSARLEAIERGIHQGFFQIAMVIAARGVTTFAPSHVNRFYIKAGAASMRWLCAVLSRNQRKVFE